MEKNLYEAIKDRKSYLPEKRVKRWIYQTLKALEYMHRNGIFHRDIKPENILLRKGNVKLADLGSCKSIYSKTPFTEYISTRWYRSPECLLTDGFYNYKMDIWGLGCVFFEMLTLIPLFPGDDEIDQVNKIHKILGSPNDDLLKKFLANSQRKESDFPKKTGTGFKKYLNRVSPLCVDLIEKMLCYDPDKRYTAKECLNHEYFHDLIQGDLHQRKTSLTSFIKQPMLLFNNNITNNSISLSKIEEEAVLKSTFSVDKDHKKSNKNTLLPNITIIKFNNNKKNTKLERYINQNNEFTEEDNMQHLATFSRLPKITQYNNSCNINQKISGFIQKEKLRGTLTKLLDENTHYNIGKNLKVSTKLKIKNKKYYVSPYSKETIANHIKI